MLGYHLESELINIITPRKSLIYRRLQDGNLRKQWESNQPSQSTDISTAAGGN